MLIALDIAGVALLLSLLLTPLVRDLCKKFDLVDRPGLPRKLHTQPIPRLGGVAVLIAYLVALAFVALAPYATTKVNLFRALQSSLALAPAVLLVFAIGVVDDLRGLSPWHKLTGETIAALLAYWAGFGIHVLNGHPLEVWISLPISVLWLVGLTNALNLIDGIDGLAAGAGMFAALTSLVAALIHGNLELALVTAPLVGALLGFLRYNFNPASIFLGDSGSLTIGFLLGCFGALWSQKPATLLGMTAPLMAVSIPLLEMVTSVIRRFLRKQPIFLSDRGHIHHRLLERGWTTRRVVVLLYAGCAIVAILALLQDVSEDHMGGVVTILFCAAAWLGVQHLGYAEFGVAGRVLFRGNFRSTVNNQLALQRFESELEKCSSLQESEVLILKESLIFGFTGVFVYLGDEPVKNEADSFDGEADWELKLPLPQGKAIYLYRAKHSAMDPVVLAAFPESLDRVLTRRLENRTCIESDKILESDQEFSHASMDK